MDLSNLRKEYKLKSLDKKDLDSDPIIQFEKWFKEAQEAKIYEPNAMALATSDTSGCPSCRMVLLKQISREGFLFFSNRTSRKVGQLQERPCAAALFFWKELERQVHLEGPVKQVSKEIAAIYFQKRPRNSQLAVWASKQGTTLQERSDLEESFKHYAELFKDREIPSPEWWTGFTLQPIRMEFWQGRESRLHDRFIYLKEKDSWILTRLSP